MRRSRLRIRIEALADSRCEYCRAPQDACGYHFHLEHIVPLARRGTNDLENRALACASCNLAKSDRSGASNPQTGEETPLFHPRNQNWREHFAWAEDQRTLLALSATGRATISCLDMNSAVRQSARVYWFAAGLLP
jgi:hypothetical protein